MQAITDAPVELMTIKGTAMNKDRARVWIERPQAELAKYGFKRGDRVEINRYSDHITINRIDAGSRKVAGRQKPNGETICIFDICFPAEEREAMFGGAARLSVLAWPNTLRIVAA